MNEILQSPDADRGRKLTNNGCDILLDHVSFSYHNDSKKILDDVSFTAKTGPGNGSHRTFRRRQTTVSRLASRFGM